MFDREIYGVTAEYKWFSYSMLLIGFGMIALAIILPDPPDDVMEQWVLRGILFISGLLPLLLCPRYRFSFLESGVLITIGYGNLIKVKLDRNKITHVGLIEWNPMKHFGGGGIKGGFGDFKGYMCFNIMRGVGIEIKTTEKNYVLEIDDMKRRRLLSMIGDYPGNKSSQPL